MGNGLKKHEKQQLYKELCSKGPSIIIDCEFDSLMDSREQLSMSQQLSYICGINKRLKQPCNIFVSGIEEGQLIKSQLDKHNYKQWAMTFIEHPRPKESTSKCAEITPQIDSKVDKN